MVGTVAFHEDHFAVVGPLVAGRISRLAAGVGDTVKRGQVIAEIESSEVGQARAELVSAKARYAAADANLRRETDLAEKKISSSREQELARAQWVTEQAGVRGGDDAPARHRLVAGGHRGAREAAIRAAGCRSARRSPARSSSGKVTLGQAVERATDAFKIADTTHVWVTLDLYEKDLARVHVGQEVEMRTDARPGETFRGRVAFIVPVIDEATRTAKVRLEFPNPIGRAAAPASWSPRASSPIRSGRRARCWRSRAAPIEQVEGKTVVFVQSRRRASSGATCSRGRRAATGSRSARGWTPGEQVAVEGAFLLKSELLR